MLLGDPAKGSFKPKGVRTHRLKATVLLLLKINSPTFISTYIYNHQQEAFIVLIETLNRVTFTLVSMGSLCTISTCMAQSTLVGDCEAQGLLGYCDIDPHTPVCLHLTHAWQNIRDPNSTVEGTLCCWIVVGCWGHWEAASGSMVAPHPFEGPLLCPDRLSDRAESIFSFTLTGPKTVTRTVWSMGHICAGHGNHLRRQCCAGHGTIWEADPLLWQPLPFHHCITSEPLRISLLWMLGTLYLFCIFFLLHVSTFVRNGPSWAWKI